MRSLQFAQAAALICGIAFTPVVLASNPFEEATQIAVSKGIRSLRSQHPESIETITVPPGNRMISTFAFPVTWRAQFATTAALPMFRADIRNVAVKNYDSDALLKAVYANASAALCGDKPGTYRLSSPISTNLYGRALSPKFYLPEGGREALVLIPYLDPMSMQDPQPTNVALIVDTDILPQAKVNKDTPQVLLEKDEKYMLESFSPGAKTFDTDWYVHSMSNVQSADSTLFGQPSRITTFEWDKGITRMNYYREIAVYPDYRTVQIVAVGRGEDFDSLVMPVIDLLRERGVVTFPPVQNLSSSTPSVRSDQQSGVSSSEQSNDSPAVMILLQIRERLLSRIDQRLETVTSSTAEKILEGIRTRLLQRIDARIQAVRERS